MTRQRTKRKPPCPDTPAQTRTPTKRTGKAAGKPATARKASKAVKSPSGPGRVSKAVLARVRTLTVERGGKAYIHTFQGGREHAPDLHAVDGQDGVLVIRGDFYIDDEGFIQDGAR